MLEDGTLSKHMIIPNMQQAAGSVEHLGHPWEFSKNRGPQYRHQRLSGHPRKEPPCCRNSTACQHALDPPKTYYLGYWKALRALEGLLFGFLGGARDGSWNEGRRIRPPQMSWGPVVPEYLNRESSSTLRLQSARGGRKYGPLLGPLNTRCRNTLRTQKGTRIVDNHP